MQHVGLAGVVTMCVGLWICLFGLVDCFECTEYGVMAVKVWGLGFGGLGFGVCSLFVVVRFKFSDFGCGVFGCGFTLRGRERALHHFEASLLGV